MGPPITERSPRTLKIAMISNYLPSGSKMGVGHQVHALANAMVDRGHDVTVFSACEPSEGARYRTRTVALGRRLRTFSFAWQLRRVDFSGFDVLHAHGDDYWLWSRRLPLHVRTMHGSCFDEAFRIHGAVARARMLLLAFGEVVSSVITDRTVLVAPSVRRWYPWVRTVIPNGVNRRVFHPGEKSAEPSILFVGTYGQRKRGWMVAEAFTREVKPAFPDATLTMVCEDTPASSGVTVTGRVGEKELADLYRRSWVFTLPSTYEGFGIPYAEAMSSGTAVVATPNQGVRFVTKNGADAVLCAPDQLGRELLRLLADPIERGRVETRGLARADDFDLVGVCEAYERVYQDRKRTRSA